MSDDEQPPGCTLEIPRPPLSEEMRQTLKSVGDFIERAREHHARTGEWPPDPLLDELNEMRRRVEAEHGNDPQKVLEWYIRAGKQHVTRNGDAAQDESSEQPAHVSRP